MARWFRTWAAAGPSSLLWTQCSHPPRLRLSPNPKQWHTRQGRRVQLGPHGQPWLCAGPPLHAGHVCVHTPVAQAA